MPTIARPLNVLVPVDTAIKWNEDCEEPFQKLKQLCSSTPILAYADYLKPFKLHTDACNLGLGAVLYQTSEDGLDRVIAYARKKLPSIQTIIPGLKMGCDGSVS